MLSRITRPIIAALTLALAGSLLANAQQLELVVDGLDAPLGLESPGDGSDRLFVMERRGTLRIIANGQVAPTPFLDIRDRVTAGGEQGLLGLAFPPDFRDTGTFYVAYSDREGATVVSRFGSEPGADTADPGSELVLLRQAQPYANHNGGHIAFGPDGYLYVGLGDGGAGGDPLGAGQDLMTWLGTLLRIDVAGDGAYRIPADNPFVGHNDALPEIWAWGLRNPWRFSFDRASGDLWIGDVGQNSYEEIDLEAATSPGGVNYGWNVMEGPECFRRADCDREELELPVISYSHESGWGRSVTGGFVYRGEAIPALQGAYLFGDFVSGTVFVARPADADAAAGAWAAEPLLETGLSIASFGEDEAGELYVVDLRGGVYRLVLN